MKKKVENLLTHTKFISRAHRSFSFQSINQKADFMHEIACMRQAKRTHHTIKFKKKKTSVGLKKNKKMLMMMMKTKKGNKQKQKK